MTGIYVTVFRCHDLPITFRCESRAEAKAAVATAQGGYWNGYRVCGAIEHEITPSPEVSARSCQAHPLAAQLL